MKTLLAVLALASATSVAHATPAGFPTDFEAARTRAVREGKDLYVSFGAPTGAHIASTSNARY